MLKIFELRIVVQLQSAVLLIGRRYGSDASNAAGEIRNLVF